MKIRNARLLPTFELESAEMALSGGPIAGVDEAGRGPLAGPVVAAAVILDPGNIPPGITDSKLLDEDTREILYARIMATSRVGIGIADVARIDADNILNATMWAMARAIDGLETLPRLALIDGNRAPAIGCKVRTVVSGDCKCLSIAAASIIAKVTRDRMMRKYAKEYPDYGFERHKGYATAEHRDALRRLGPTPLHRRSFRPVQYALGLIDDPEFALGSGLAEGEAL